MPGHVALRRLRAILCPGGLLLCSTPNLYRLRNIVYLVRGRALFDRFDLPGVRGYGRVLEYSAEHLAWQFGRAGCVDYAVELRDFTHVPRLRPRAESAARRAVSSAQKTRGGPRRAAFIPRGRSSVTIALDPKPLRGPRAALGMWADYETGDLRTSWVI